MPPAAEHNPDTLRDLFTHSATDFQAGDTSPSLLPAIAQELVVLATDMAQATWPSPHPLEQLLPLAASSNRRADLLAIVRAAYDLAPHDARLLELEAALCLHTGALEHAERAAREALNRRPDHQPTKNLLTAILTHAGRFDEALTLLQELHRLAPDDAGIVSNLAYLAMAQNDIEGSIAHYRRAIALKPDQPQIRLNHSIALLKGGYFQQGWAEHEWRFGLPGHSNLPRERILPNITPDLDLRGRRVLLTQEEGLGDTLMYLRYVPILAKRGAIIRAWGAETLARLTARVDGVESVQVGGETPEYDYHCPFISLPRAFSATTTPFGASVPYLRADPIKAARWATRFSDDDALRVGLVWAGAPRPENTDAYMLDQRRSMPFSTLEPITKLEGITFYSLQKGATALQLRDSSAAVVNVMDEMGDMDDTAAFIDNLDVIVSVDTSVVHLAGGMGKKVILMDRINPCWRWHRSLDGLPWYPHLRIVRQNRAWHWEDVVEEVAHLLQQEVKVRTS